MSLIKYAALANKLRLYNCVKGILRVKLAAGAAPVRIPKMQYRMRMNRGTPIMQSYDAAGAVWNPVAFTGRGRNYGLMMDATGNLSRQAMNADQYAAWLKWAQSARGQKWLASQDPAMVKRIMGRGWKMPTPAPRAPRAPRGAGAPGGPGAPPVSDNPFGDWAARVGWTGLGAAGLYAGMNWLGSDGGYKNSSSYDPAYDPTKNFDSYTNSYGNPSGYAPSRDIVSPWASQ